MDEQVVDRKIPWWVWAFVALSVLVFVSFFLTFAIGVSSGAVD
jgi:hypothetical protein